MMSKRCRSKFLPEEDERLSRLVKEHGDHNWEMISSKMIGRNPRQCRERWKHYLSADYSKKEWSTQDDLMLLEKLNEFGPKWTKIAYFLDGKTDIQVKSRFQFLQQSTNSIGKTNETQSMKRDKSSNFDISSVFPDDTQSSYNNFDYEDFWLFN